jgi:hypothetical protein
VHSNLFPLPIRAVAAETLTIAILAITANTVTTKGLLTVVAVAGIAYAPLSGTRLSLNLFFFLIILA